MGTERNRYLMLANLLPLECIVSLLFEIALFVMEDIRISWYRDDPQFYPYGFDMKLYTGLTATLYTLVGLKCINIPFLLWGRRNNMQIHLWVRLAMLKLGIIVWVIRSMVFCRQRFADQISFITVAALYSSFNTIVASGVTLQAIEVLVRDDLRENPYKVFYRRWTYCRLPLWRLNVAIIATSMIVWVYSSMMFVMYGVEELSKLNGMGDPSVAFLSSMVVIGVLLVGGILNAAGIIVRNERILFLTYLTMKIIFFFTICWFISSYKFVKLDLKPSLVISFVTVGMNFHLVIAICDIQSACIFRWITYITLEKTLKIGDANLGQTSCFQSKDDIPKQRAQILEDLYVQMPWRLSTEEEVIGEGHFSKVYKVELRTFCSKKTKVLAAKEVQMDDIDAEDYALALVSEIKTLQVLGKHENLVDFAGLYRMKPSGGLGILLEFCENGSLLNHLRIIREEEVLQTAQSNVFQKCLEWSKGIAKGMEYLHSRNVVHGDLATRNILLDRNMVPKLSDFGMSFKLYIYDTYKRTGQKPLPFRWMSPEVLLDYKFSPASDVWAYGVTLWEIFSLGDQPWGTCSFDSEFVRNIRIKGKRLQRPELCTETLYASILLKCWELEPQARLEATWIATVLEDYCNAKGCTELRLIVT